MSSPTQKERTTAALMHVGSIFAPLIAPAACYVLHRQRSEFVAKHSLKAMKEWLILNICLLVAGIASLCYTIWRLIDLYQHDWQGFSIVEFVVRFLIGYLLLALLGFVTAVLSLKQALRAYRGLA